MADKKAPLSLHNIDNLVNEELLGTKANPDEYIANNGLKFQLKKVPSMLLAEAAGRIEDPKVPMVMDDDKGRPVENPADPDYRKACEKADYDRGQIMANVTLGMGTRVISFPDGIEKPEDEGWAQDILELVGPDFNIPKAGKTRYVAWLKWYALDDTEINRLLGAIGRFSGSVLEMDVAKAVDTFRRNETRPGSPGNTSPEEGGLRDRNNESGWIGS